MMVNIEEHSEEDQRMYIVLQEFIKPLFLSGAKMDCSSKVMMAQEFELPMIKVNKDKVVPTVCQPPSDLFVQLPAISENFDRAFMIRII
jgi:hypothetical protein